MDATTSKPKRRAKRRPGLGRPKKITRTIVTTINMLPAERDFIKAMAKSYGVSMAEIIRNLRVQGCAPAALSMDFSGGAFQGMPEIELEAAQLLNEYLEWRLRVNAFSMKLPGAVAELARHMPQGIPLPGGQRAVPPSAEIGAEKPRELEHA